MDPDTDAVIDDDVTVETIDEGQGMPQATGATENSNPDWLVGGFFNIVDVIQSNGWIFLVIFVCLWFLKRKLEDHLREKRKRDEDGIHAKDPDKLLDLQLRREDRIRRLQEQQDAAAAVAAAKQREKEEKERKERIQDYDDFLSGKGYKPKSKHNVSSNDAESEDPTTPPSTTPSLLSNRPRPRLRDDDFSPMMGSGGSGGYRPAPRGGGSGGG